MTNTIPAPIHLLLLLFIWSALAARWTLLRFNNYDVRLTHALSFASAALVLKDPTVASVLTPAIGETLTRAIVHVLILWSIAALVGVYNSWDPAEPSWMQPALYTVATLIGALLVVLSAPARDAGTTVEQAGGWQAIAYFALYAGFNGYGLGRVTVDYLRTWRQVTSTSARVTVIGVVVFLMSMLVESVQMLIAAVCTNLGVGAAFVAAKQHANGWLFAVMMVVAVALSALPFLRADIRAATRDQLRIHRLWKILAKAEPELVLGTVRDRRSLSEGQRQLRVASEAHAVAQALGSYAPPITEGRWDKELDRRGVGVVDRAAVYQAAQLQDAIERRRAGGAPIADLPRTRPGVDDADATIASMMSLARQWRLARQLRRSDRHTSPAVSAP
ncbi:DUF6545 domain-containing protein [Prescottella subtropica]|uniref:DUF6545 domain-containing protein n=1 Tax=Prescottella subtropica TaxID=2545757 RepID=UPI0010F81453|nr:DUF6545 domain-containing protein [Prescottella subtropica]